jgi:DNA-binding XRE family transcriptional regulator
MYLKKPCVHCGEEATRQQYVHTEEFAGVKVSDPRVQTYICTVCGQPEMTLDLMAKLQRNAASIALRDLSAVKGGVLKYARKAAGLRQVDLGKLLNLAAETISRAETSSGNIDRTLQMAMLGILQQLECGATVAELLASAERPAPLSLVELVAADPIHRAA